MMRLSAHTVVLSAGTPSRDVSCSSELAGQDVIANPDSDIWKMDIGQG